MASFSLWMCVVGIVFALLGVLVHRRYQQGIDDRLFDVLNGLIRAEERASLSNVRVAVGFGGCRDIILNASQIFEKLNASLPLDPYHVDTVTSKEDLENLVAFFYRHGAASERYVSNKKLFDAVKAAIHEIPADHKAEYVAGAAPTMAKKLDASGADVLLAASFSDLSLQEIPASIKVVGEKVEEDDLHVIMEYKVNEVMGPYTAPRDNRAIIHSDVHSPYLDALEEFIDEVESFKPTLVILSGLQMMDNFPFKPNEREERLTKLRSLLKSLPLSVKIHLEMASFTELKLLQQIIEFIIPHVDSMGMNEQELPNIVTAVTKGTVKHVSDSKPRIATVLDNMRKLYLEVDKLPSRSRQFTRLHVHTLAYQAILTDVSSNWKQTMSATAKASLTAHRYTCNTDVVDTKKAKLIVDESFLTSLSQQGKRVEFKSNRPVACWKEDSVEICVAPVLVCTKVHQTAGAGDNISSSGLIVQI